MDRARFLLEVYLACVFGISGLTKIDRLRLFAVTLRRQQILPVWAQCYGSGHQVQSSGDRPAR